MENTKIFKRLEVVGTTKDEAMHNAPFYLRVNATHAYEKWRKSTKDVSEAAVSEWMKEYLKTKKFNTAGDGAFIVVQTAVGDTRKRPYQVKKIKHDAKTHTPQLSYVVRNAAGEIVATEKKAVDAMAAAKSYTTDLHETTSVNREALIKEGNSLYAVVEYTPSKGTQNAILLCFGYVNAD